VLEANGVIVSPSLEKGALVEKQGLTDTDAVTGNFFAFDIQTSVDALQEELHRTLLPLCAASAHSVLGGRRFRTDPGRVTHGLAPMRRVRGSFHGHALQQPTPAKRA